MKAPSILIAIVMAPVIALSQSTEPMKTKALQFNINGLTLSGINGGVGGKLWVEDDLALVGSLDGSFSRNFGEARDTSERDSKERYWGVVVNVGLERHFDWTPGLSPYLVGGALLGYDYSYRTYGSSTTHYVSKAPWLSMGVRGGFGLEYWLSPRISVAGQQLVLVQYRIGKNEDRVTPNPMISRDVSQFRVDVGTSSLILSVYL